MKYDKGNYVEFRHNCLFLFPPCYNFTMFENAPRMENKKFGYEQFLDIENAMPAVNEAGGRMLDMFKIVSRNVKEIANDVTLG